MSPPESGDGAQDVPVHPDAATQQMLPLVAGVSGAEAKAAPQAQPGGLFRNAIVYVGTNAISAAIPFLLLPVLTRVLTPEQYGTIAMFTLVVAVVGAFTGLNVHGAIGVRYFEPERIHLPRYVLTCLAILAATTAAMLLLVALLSPVLERFTTIPGRWLLVAVIVAGAQFVIQTQLSLWQSARQAVRYGILRVLQALTDAGVSLWLVLAVGLAWQGRVAGISFAMLLTAGIAGLALVRGGWVGGSVDRAYARDALRFGVPLIPHAVGGILIAMVDRFMITNILDVASTGLYMVALQIAMGLGLLTDAFNRAFAPWLLGTLRRADGVLERRIVRMTYLYFVLVAAAAALIGLLAPLLVGLFAGEDFRAAAPMVAYIALGYAFGGMYYMVTNYVFYAGRTGSLALVTLATGGVNLLLSFYLLRTRGVVGAAQAYMIAQALLFTGTWILAQRSRPMPWLRGLLPVAA